MKSPRVGIQIGAATPPADLAAISSEAERLGYGEIWLAENYFELGGIATAAIALGATNVIPVGLGVVAAVARHPAVTSMEFATLAAAYPRRFMAGIGHGVAGGLRQMGLEPASPLRQLREAVDTVRRLLRGEETTVEGEYFRSDQIQLHHRPIGDIPLYLGVHGPSSLRLSGELADGTLLGWFSSPGYVAWARGRIDEGRATGSEKSPHELTVLCVLSIDEAEPDTARHEISNWAAPRLANLATSPHIKQSAGGVELLEYLGRADPTAGAVDLPASILGEFVAAGDATSCAATVDRLLEAGADRVILVPNPAGFRSTAAMVEQMRIASKLAGTR